MKWAAVGAAIGILLASGQAGADITYLSQERSIKNGKYYVPRIPPSPPETQPFYSVTTVTAPDMGPFSATLGQASQTSSFDQNGIRASGYSGDLTPGSASGNQFLEYNYGASQTKVVFDVSQPTAFTSIWKFPYIAGPPGPSASLDSPGGGHFNLSSPTVPVSGVLSPGTWTFLASADAVSGAGWYNVEVSFVPEPVAMLPVVLAGAACVRRRRA
jgi:hypothetical protein